MATLRKMYGEALITLGAKQVASRTARYEVYAKDIKLTSGEPSIAYFFVGAAGAVRKTVGIQKINISRSMSEEWKCRLLREAHSTRAAKAEAILEDF